METSADTIFALSSGRPRSAIAVVRISGPRAGQALAMLGVRQPQPRRASLVTLTSPDGTPIDDGLVLWFPRPASATGEDIVELHVHGSPAVLTALFEVLAQVEGLRPAEAGEFTRRAFEHGKLDLTEAEGLADLIDADTEMQRRQALRQLKGLLGKRAEQWRRDIIAASALIAAGIDFSDEGDVPQELMSEALEVVGRLREEIEETLGRQAQSERLRDGLVVAIAGPPNVGKSTLLNHLANRDAAIVSPHAGTTRDAIEVHLDLEGYPLVLVDTAGIRDTDDVIEQEGVRRARARAEDADLVLWLVDASGAHDEPPSGIGATLWTVHNKIDLVPDGGAALARASNDAQRDASEFFISAASGQGIEMLTSALTAFAETYFGGGESVLITRARHRTLLNDAAASLGRALESASRGEEIVAEELRTAAYALGRLTGRVDVEDVLDKIFKDFCIGK